jgi:hypothetical protein
MAAGHDGMPPGGDRAAPGLLVATDGTGAALARLAAKRCLAWSDIRAVARDALPDAIRATAPGGGVAACCDAIADGVALLDAVEAASRAGSRIVLLDGAATAPGGAIPAERLRRALLEAAGAVVAESHADLLDLAFLLAAFPALPARGGIAILTGGGGGGVIAADLCAAAGLVVPPLSEETRRRLQPLVPAIASTANPVDLTPEMFTERFYDRFGAAMDACADDPAVDAVLLPTTFNAPRGPLIAAQVLADFAARCPKPVLIASDPSREMLEIFTSAGTALVSDVAHAARALAKLVRRAAWRPPAPAAAGELDPDALGFRLGGRAEATPDGLAAAARRLGFPLVLSRDGREAADIWDEAELAEAADRVASHGAAGSRVALRRDLPGQLTLRILATRDAAFGPAIAIGAGGVQGRIRDMLAVARAPLDADAAASLLAAHPVVAHARKMLGTLDLAPAAAALARLSAAAAAERGRFDLVLDPVEIAPDGWRVLDGSLARSDR